MFHNCEGQSHKTVSTDHNLKARSQEMASYSTYPGADGKTKADRKKSRYLSGRLENGTYRNIYHRLENEVTATSNGAGWKKRSLRDVYRSRLVKEVIGADWKKISHRDVFRSRPEKEVIVTAIGADWKLKSSQYVYLTDWKTKG